MKFDSLIYHRFLCMNLWRFRRLQKMNITIQLNIQHKRLIQVFGSLSFASYGFIDSINESAVHSPLCLYIATMPLKIETPRHFIAFFLSPRDTVANLLFQKQRGREHKLMLSRKTFFGAINPLFWLPFLKFTSGAPVLSMITFTCSVWTSE